MIVASPQARARPLKTLTDLGYQCTEMDDPYAAMADLCRRPLVYQSLVLCLGSLYREELEIIHSVKRRFPHIDIWLSGTDARAAALAHAMRLGADGLLADDGLHRTALLPSRAENPRPAAAPLPPEPPEAPAPAPLPARPPSAPAEDEGEPVLSAEELRALLRDPR